MIVKTVKVIVKAGKEAIKNLDDVKQGFEGIEQGSKDATVATGGLTFATRALGMALKAAGIGLVISLLVGLGNAFMKNQKVMDIVNTGLEILSLTFGSVANTFVNIIEGLYEMGMATGFFEKRIINVTNIITTQLNMAMNSFNLAMQTATLLWNMSPFGDGANIEDIKNLGKEIVKFGGDQKALIEDQVGNVETFIDDTKLGIDIMTTVWKEQTEGLITLFTDSENNIIKVSAALVQLRNDVKLAEAEQRKLQLTFQKDAETQRQIRDDISKTIDERIEANEELGKVLEKQVKEELRVANIRVKLAQKEHDQDKDNIDLQVALQNAKNEVLDIEERVHAQTSEQKTNEAALQDERIANMQELSSIGKSAYNEQLNQFDVEMQKRIQLAERTISNEEELQQMLIKIRADKDLKILELDNLIAQEKKKADAEKVAKQKREDDEDLKKAEEKFIQQQQNIDNIQGMFATMGKIRQEAFVKEQNELDKQLEKGLITQEEYDKETRKIEKASLRAEKRNAKFQILIDTAQGVAAAIKAGAGLIFPANLAAIGSGVAAVLSGIASAKAVLNQVPGGGSAGGEESVDLESDLPGGLGGLIPNMGAIEQPELGGQPVQAYVVETDISDAQALQEELDIQATL